MGRMFEIINTLEVREVASNGLPRVKPTNLVHFAAYGNHTGRWLDAVAAAAYEMVQHARQFAGAAQRFAEGSAYLLQTMRLVSVGEVRLTLQQILYGWPIIASVWLGRIGQPALAPLQRDPRCPRTDVNGQYTPLPVRLYVRRATSGKVDSNNKLRLWRVSAEGFPPSYCVFWPDGDCRFIHVARLVQHYLAADPEHWQDYL